MASQQDLEIARRLHRLHEPRTEAGRALAAKIARRLSQVAAAPAPCAELLASALLSRKRVSVELRRESKGQMLDPGCYAEVVVVDGTIRTAVRLAGNEALFAQAVPVASFFDLFADRAAEAAERLADLPSAPPSPIEISVVGVERLGDLNLGLDREGPQPEIVVGGIINATVRVYLGGGLMTSGAEGTTVVKDG
jgi:O-phosphoseryl-tRNA(Cys) synthetase